MVIQSAVDMAELCALHGIKNVVICPGSRNAALTIAFVRSKKFSTYSVSDERSAGYIALGMAQISKTPTVMICTSGTAALNFAPAVAEAFFLQIPLLVITADRPDEWINQFDGQTIFQKNIFGHHVIGSFNLSADRFHPDQIWAFERQANQAILSLKQNGPVHINFAIREPFYPNKDEVLKPSDSLKKTEKTNPAKNQHFSIDLLPKTLFVIGQQDDDLRIDLPRNIPIVADAISNAVGDDVIHFQDAIDFDVHPELIPSMVVSLGKSLISKNLKLFLRKNKAIKHIHVQPGSTIQDPTQSISDLFDVQPLDFLRNLMLNRSSIKDEYFQSWKKVNLEAKTKIEKYLNSTPIWSEAMALNCILASAPENSILCFGNSMSVRFGNICPEIYHKNLIVYANRGTSGIDGCISTAVGIALKTQKVVTCVVGDLSFFYDRNALWNTHVPSNFRLVVLNNYGGAIFNMIDGPATQQECAAYFVTPQTLSIKNTIQDTTLEYFAANQKEELPSDFYNGDQSKALELNFSSSAENWKAIKEAIKV